MLQIILLTVLYGLISYILLSLILSILKWIFKIHYYIKRIKLHETYISDLYLGHTFINYDTDDFG